MPVKVLESREKTDMPMCASMCRTHEHIDVRTSMCMSVCLCVYVHVSNP